VEEALVAFASATSEGDPSVQKNGITSTRDETRSGDGAAPNQFRATGPPSPLHAEFVFLKNQAEAFQLKAQAKELDAKALRAREGERQELFQQARVLETEADAVLLRAQASRALGQAELIAHRLTALSSGRPISISAGDVIQIRASGTLPGAPITGVFQIEPTGKVALGPEYGRIEIGGRTVEEAGAIIEQHLRETAELRAPKVQVTLANHRNLESADRFNRGLTHGQQPGTVGDVLVRANAPDTVSSSAAVTSPSPAAGVSDEIQLLTELVTAYEGIWEGVRGRYKAGTAGGEAENEAAARQRLLRAKAQLALARGDRPSAAEHYRSAVQAAQQQVDAYRAAYDAGTATLEVLLESQARLIEVKMQLSRLKDR
jgi:hypothetical protein